MPGRIAPPASVTPASPLNWLMCSPFPVGGRGVFLEPRGASGVDATGLRVELFGFVTNGNKVAPNKRKCVQKFRQHKMIFIESVCLSVSKHLSSTLISDLTH